MHGVVSMSTLGPKGIAAAFIDVVISGKVQQVKIHHKKMMVHFATLSLSEKQQRLKRVLAEALKWAAAKGYLWIVKFLVFTHKDIVSREMKIQALRKAIIYRADNVKIFLLGQTDLEVEGIYKNPNFLGGAEKGSIALLKEKYDESEISQNHAKYYASVFIPNFANVLEKMKALSIDSSAPSAQANFYTPKNK